MQDTLLSLGEYGGPLVVGFVAGLLPIISIEVFLIVVVAKFQIDSFAQLAAMIVLAAIGHQIAKTITYYAGIGALERGKMQQRMEKVRTKIDKWNKRPGLVLFLAATVGIPPIYIIGYIAEPLMKIPFWRFTIVCFVGRIGRYAVMSIGPWLL